MFKKAILFTYFWLLDFGCHVGFPLAAESRGTVCCSAQAPCGGPSCSGVQAAGHVGFSSSRPQAAKHRLNSCGTQAGLLLGMWHLPQLGMEPCPCTGRWILYNWATREAPVQLLSYLAQCLPALATENHFGNKFWSLGLLVAMISFRLLQLTE